MSRFPVLLVAVAMLPLCVGVRAQSTANGNTGAPGASGIAPTNHPPLPAQPSLYWLVPEPGTGRSTEAGARFARGAKLIDDGDFAAGLPLVQGADLAATPLADYSRYYVGVALHGLRRFEEAGAALEPLEGDVAGFLQEAVPLRRAEIAMARGDADEAAELLDDLSDKKALSAPEEVLLRLGAALEAAGERDDAVKAYQRVYYDFPLSSQAADAEQGIARLQTPELIPGDRFRLELNRAERLFSARRWAQARAAFASLAKAVDRDKEELIGLRLAECDYHLDRFRASRDALRPYVRDGAHQAEARYFYLSATRGLGDRATYLTLVRELAADHPDSSWTEEALNNLASRYITDDDDAAADGVFRELLRKFPRGRYADRAGWETGWLAYKQDRFADAAATFEASAAAFPRADYRPSWLYWAARSRDQLGQRAAANALYRVVVGDYQNSYYGRLASALLAERREPSVSPTVVATSSAAPASPRVENDAVIRALLAVDMYDAAFNEVEYARRASGDAVPLQATLALIRHRRGLEDGADERFVDVRGGITMMRRAYPQFMAAGGENLPPGVLQVIFPLDYWPLIKKHSDAHKLDPYLMSALIAQESTFTPDVRSSANAVGLMQLIPATGRRYARTVGIPYSARMLTQPESNIRLGMRYFRDLMDRFGSAHYALASYNAGEHRIVRWIAERPGFEQDEFVDDIPFAETRNYVKRILGTADDYRRLYGGGVLSTTPSRR